MVWAKAVLEANPLKTSITRKSARMLNLRTKFIVTKLKMFFYLMGPRSKFIDLKGMADL
jgi:hypothetical protein